MGCSTAVIVGKTSVQSAVPDMQQMRASAGMRNPRFCIMFFAPISAVSVNPNTASNGMFLSRKADITSLPSSALNAGGSTSVLS